MWSKVILSLSSLSLFVGMIAFSQIIERFLALDFVTQCIVSSFLFAHLTLIIIWFVKIVEDERSIMFIFEIFLCFFVASLSLHAMSMIHAQNNTIETNEMDIKTLNSTVANFVQSLTSFTTELQGLESTISESTQIQDNQNQKLEQKMISLRDDFSKNPKISFSSHEIGKNEVLKFDENPDRAFYIAILSISASRQDLKEAGELNCITQKFINNAWHSTKAHVLRTGYKGGDRGHSWLYGGIFTSNDILESNVSQIKFECPTISKYTMSDESRLYVTEFYFE